MCNWKTIKPVQLQLWSVCECLDSHEGLNGDETAGSMYSLQQLLRVQTTACRAFGIVAEIRVHGLVLNLQFCKP